MRQKPSGRPSSSEQIIRDIKRKTRRHYSAEENPRGGIVVFLGRNAFSPRLHPAERRFARIDAKRG